MAADPARNCWVTICAVLLLASERYVLAQPVHEHLPWKMFNNEVRGTAEACISKSTIDVAAAGRKQELAGNVLAGIQSKEDPICGISMSNFGVYFAVVVWSAGIPPNLQGIFALGERIVFGSSPNVRVVEQGTVVTTGCSGGALYRNQRVGAFGLPCKTGASILIEQTTYGGSAVDCFVMYTRRLPKVSMDSMWTMFDDALTNAQQMEPRLRSPNPDLGAKVDLTRTIASFFEKSREMSVKGGRRMFTGAAFIPAAMPMSDGDVSDYMGLASSCGGLLNKLVTVAQAVNLDLNLLPEPEVFFYAVAFGPLPQL